MITISGKQTGKFIYDALRPGIEKNYFFLTYGYIPVAGMIDDNILYQIRLIGNDIFFFRYNGENFNSLKIKFEEEYNVHFSIGE